MNYYFLLLVLNGICEKLITVAVVFQQTILMKYLFMLVIFRNPMALFDGDTENYDEDDGYTSPKSDYLSIIIQFGQPYIIDSMRYK